MAKADPLRRLIREHPSIETFIEALEEIHFGSDRAAAILSMAALEHYLQAVILLHFPNRDYDTLAKLTGTGGALFSFHNNIQLAYCMGLIDETSRDDLNTIRQVRNVFAHAMGHVSFKTPEIKKACDKLKTEAEYSRPMLDTEQIAPPERQRYIAVTNHIGFMLLAKAAEKLDEGEESGRE